MNDTKGTELKKIFLPMWLMILVSGLLLFVSLWMVFFYAPEEKTMGVVQKIFYFHVASAWIGFMAFFVTFLGSVFFLLYKAKKWDILAKSSAEIGFVFISITLVTGMLWAKPVWGVFWAWEPRLTISAVQWLLYFSYSLLRKSSRNRNSEARLAAVFGILAFITVPLSWYAIRIWRTIHPQVFAGSSTVLPPKMMATLIVSVVVFTFIYLSFLIQRMQLEYAQHNLTENS